MGYEVMQQSTHLCTAIADEPRIHLWDEAHRGQPGNVLMLPIALEGQKVRGGRVWRAGAAGNAECRKMWGAVWGRWRAVVGGGGDLTWQWGLFVLWCGAPRVCSVGHVTPKPTAPSIPPDLYFTTPIVPHGNTSGGV